MTRETIDEAFERFDDNNPKVYELFVRFAREASNSGRRFGAKAVWERIRWEAPVVVEGQLAYDLNNNFVSRYARKAMAENADLAGFFEVRDLRSRRPLGPTVAQRHDAGAGSAGSVVFP